jgi:hypothetical protein
MGDLAVRAIGDARRPKQSGRLSRGDPWQEAIEPRQERLRRQETPHAFGLDQRRGLEVVAARLAPSRAIDILAIPTAGRFEEKSGQCGVAGRRCVIGRHSEAEGRVEMGAGAHGIGRERQEIAKSLRDRPRQRRERPRPARIVRERQFRGELEQPGPAVGALEAARRRPVEIGALARDLLARELVVEQGAYVGGATHAGKATQQPRQHPMAMDARMPIKAAIEDRMQVARGMRILRPGQRMIEVVRIFAADMPERQAGEGRGEIAGEGRHGHRGASRGSRFPIRRPLRPGRTPIFVDRYARDNPATAPRMRRIVPSLGVSTSLTQDPSAKRAPAPSASNSAGSASRPSTT